MSKAQTINATWQARAGSASTHASRTGANLLGWDRVEPEQLTPEQEREALKARWKQLHQRTTEDKTLTKEQRKELGREMHELATAMSKIRPKMTWRGLENYILELVQQSISKEQWRQLVETAKRNYAADQNKGLVQ